MSPAAVPAPHPAPASRPAAPGAAPYIAPLAGGVVKRASPITDGAGETAPKDPLAAPAPEAAPIELRPLPAPPPIASAPIAPLPTEPSDSGLGEILVAPTGPAPIPPVSSPDAEAYIDGLVPTALARGGLTGAVVVLVKDGQVLLAKGYGYADREQGKPMNAARTLVRPGSISKLFTWTAVMQLVERGKLDLDADINTYLDFRIRDEYGQAITLRHLMTHSAGFEESSKHLFAAQPSQLMALGDYVKAVQPQRIFPPGQVPAYSNYGVALAGYIVQRVAREPFDDYVEEHIFAPLGMRHSSFRQPLPKGLAADMAKSYVAPGAPPIPFELVNAAPAGSLSTTGEDMARFMIAHLDQGRYRNDTILQTYTAQAMQNTLVRPIPGLDAMSLGFFRHDSYGPITLGHGGATEAFQSDLVLLPEHKLGVFVSASGPARAGRALHRDLIDGLLRRYYPAREPPPPTQVTAYLHGRQIEGRYESSRQSSGNFLAIGRLFATSVIELNGDETVSVSSLRKPDGRVKRWREIGPYLWREVDGDSRLAAKVIDNEVIAVSSDDVPAAMWLQPVPAWRSPGWIVPLLYLAAMVHVLALALWPVAALIRHRTQRPLLLDSRERDLRLLTFIGLSGNVLLALLWVWILSRAEVSVRSLDGSLDPLIRIAQLLGLLSIATAVIAALNLRAAWSMPVRRLRRACAVAIAVACIAVVWLVFALKTMQWSLVY
ncbi:serine hydrolase domain-containing protein [Lysobacter sp. TAB13]|uniref:serine hydrolase domain-containing protein n=1 Tax=Lysobacter sp. TAB13 TaxID=3233065 RepID=UPI003F95F1E1